MVFFCGAGISVPTGLPSFPRLVERLFDSLNISPDAGERRMIERKEFAEALDHLERRATDDAMRLEVARLLSSVPEPDSLRLHQALLQVSRNASGMHLVTTNYDDNFARANSSGDLNFHAWPTLPELDDWNSLVHLHGRIEVSKEMPVASRLVLTDKDFGEAYLAEAKAAKFVSELIQRYTVVFVGYSMTDVVVRYLTKALARRHLAGRTYSLVGFADQDQREERESEWSETGIHPIFYQSRNKHELLVRTVEEWAKLAADPHRYRIQIAVSGLMGAPDKETHETDPDRVVWAVSDPAACWPTVNRVRQTPVPGAYAAAWLQEFAVRGLLAGTIQPEPHERGPAGPVVTVRAEQQMLQTDRVADAVAYWIEINAHSPEVFWWVISHGRNIGFELRRRLWDRLTTNEEDLPEIPPRLVHLWSLLLAEPPEDAQFLLRLDRILKCLSADNREVTDDILLRLLRPRLVAFPGPAPYRILPPDTTQEQLALLSCGHTDVILGCLDEQRRFDILTEIEPNGYRDFLRRHAITLTEYLKTAFALLHRSDQINVRFIHAELSNEFRHRAVWTGDVSADSNAKPTRLERRRSLSEVVGRWTVLVDWVRESYRALPENGTERDDLLRYWAKSDEKMLWRLSLEAIEQDGQADFDLVRLVLHRNAQEVLWDSDCSLEVLSVLRLVGTRASEQVQTDLLDSVQGRMGSSTPDADSDGAVLSLVGARLAALNEGGVILNPAAAQTLTTFETRQGTLRRNESEVATAVLGGRIREVAIALRTDSVDTARFQKLAKRRPAAAILALQELGQGGDWPSEMWKVALEAVRAKLKDTKSRSHRNAKLSEVLKEIPQDLFQILQFQIANLVELLAERWPGTDDSRFWHLWLRGWENRSHRSSILSPADGLTKAMNTTAGTYAAAAMKRISMANRQTSTPITREQMAILDQISSDASGLAGVVMLVFQLEWLYSSATDWTTRHVLPRMRWMRGTQSTELEEEVRTLWGAFAIRGRITYALVRVLGSDLWTAVQRHKDLDGGENLVRFFVHVSMSPQMDLIDELTCRTTAQIVIEQSPLQVGAALRQRLVEYDEPADQVWRDFVHPWLHRFWPREKRLNTVASSSALVQVIMCTGDAFPEAVDWASSYLIASNEPKDRQIAEVCYYKNTWKPHPKATVALLHCIVPEVKIDSWQRASLLDILKTLRELDANIPRDAKFVELERRATR